MCALRGDLFQIADEDPLALVPDAVAANEPIRCADRAGTTQQGTCASETDAGDGTHFHRRRSRLVAFAALLCAAALVVLSATGPRQPELPPQGLTARPPKSDLPGGRREQTREAHGADQVTRRSGAGKKAQAAAVSTPTQSSVDPVTPAASQAVPSEPLPVPESAELEFGFER